jgi:hypothetical protein
MMSRRSWPSAPHGWRGRAKRNTRSNQCDGVRTAQAGATAATRSSAARTHCLSTACGIPVLRRNDLKIGEDVTETLELIPRQWKVIQHVRDKFSCRACEAITQPPAPSHPITHVKSQRTPTPFSRPRTTPLMEPVSAGRNWWRGGYARFLKRQLSLPVSTMSQW